MLDGIVVDKSGIVARFDFTLDFNRGPSLSVGAPADPDRFPPMQIAIQEQLGLKLERKAGPFDVIVVDRARQVPTDN
jgi:uncharacterized protein (TIGR03435 family)